MTTAIPEDFFTLAVPLREGPGSLNMTIPASQQRADDTAYTVKLPAGLHTVQLLWNGDATTIRANLRDGTTQGQTIALLPGGKDAKMVTVSIVAPSEGVGLAFFQQQTVTAEQIGTPRSTLGVNVILNPARTKES